MIGLLFARPSDPFAKANIVGELDYFNSRSGEHIDFFCVGYTKNPHNATLKKSEPTVVIKGASWWFDNDSFDSVRRQLEAESNWQYSGETELLVANARSSFREAVIDYSSAIPCRLELMQSDKAINSVREFFEKIFKSAEKNPDSNNPMVTLSDEFGKTVALSAIKKIVLLILLKGLHEEYAKARHFVLGDLSKKN